MSSSMERITPYEMENIQHVPKHQPDIQWGLNKETKKKHIRTMA